MSVGAPTENFTMMEYDEPVEIRTVQILEEEEDVNIGKENEEINLENDLNGISYSKLENENMAHLEQQNELPPAEEWNEHGCIMGEPDLNADLDTQPIEETLLIQKCEQETDKNNLLDSSIRIMDNFQSQMDKNGTLELSSEWNDADCAIVGSVVMLAKQEIETEEQDTFEIEEEGEEEDEEQIIELDDSDEILESKNQGSQSESQNKSDIEEETQELADAWSEPGCIICNVDIEASEEPKTAAQVKEQNKLKNFFMEVMAVGQDIRLEEEEFFPFCPNCTQEVNQLMGMGYKIDFMHRQFDKARDSLASKCVKTFILRTKPELMDQDEEIIKLPHEARRSKATNRERVLDGWKRRYEVVQPGPKNPVMIRSMDSRGRVTVVRINSKGEAILPPERYPKRGGVDLGKLKRWEEEPDDDEEGGPSPAVADTNIYKCPDCSKTFNSKSMLTYHSRIHSGEFPFECEVCGRGFAVPHYLITHMRCHTGEKPYKCAECGKGFAQRGGLATHSLVHTGAKPYICPECGKSFRQKYHLTQHSLIHSGVKPFPCEICGKSFNVKMNLREHMRRHTGDRPYKCPYCTVVGFFRKKMLREHIAKTHPQRSLPEELLEPSSVNIPTDSYPIHIETINEDQEELSNSSVAMPDDNIEEPQCLDISNDDSNRDLKFAV